MGRLAAEKLLARGDWTVYAAARGVEKMKDLEQKGARLLRMDVTSTEEVNEGAERIIREEGRIDGLLANAGYGEYGMIEAVSVERVRRQFEVNVLGVARAVKAVLPKMRERRAGRIVVTTSLASEISILGLGWYAATKHAVKAMAVALRQEVKEMGIEVVMIEPGAVKTAFDETALGELHAGEGPKEYREYVEGFEGYIRRSYRRSPGPERTAECMVRALTARRPKTVYKTTFDAKALPKLVAMTPDRVFDDFMLASIKRAGRKQGHNVNLRASRVFW